MISSVVPYHSTTYIFKILIIKSTIHKPICNKARWTISSSNSGWFLIWRAKGNISIDMKMGFLLQVCWTLSISLMLCHWRLSNLTIRSTRTIDYGQLMLMEEFISNLLLSREKTFWWKFPNSSLKWCYTLSSLEWQLTLRKQSRRRCNPWTCHSKTCIPHRPQKSSATMKTWLSHLTVLQPNQHLRIWKSLPHQLVEPNKIEDLKTCIRFHQWRTLADTFPSTTSLTNRAALPWQKNHKAILKNETNRYLYLLWYQ